MQSVKTIEAVVPELIWWKHTKACHGNSPSLAGEGGYYTQDAVLDFALGRQQPVTVIKAEAGGQ